MDLKKQEFQMEFAGKPLKLSVSKLAEQANSAVIGQYGDTVVLATVVMGEKEKDTDYFPLQVDYEEKFYAVGKILGSRFVRREGRPSENAILTGRLIDRTIRPLFDQRMRREVQVVATVLSYDENNDPDFIALLTVSAALANSEIPWNGPVAGIRVVKTKTGETLINPTVSDLNGRTDISFDGFIGGTADRINMIELSGNESPEGDIVEGFTQAHEEIKKAIKFQKEIVEKTGKPKATILLKEPDGNLKNKIQEFLVNKLETAVYVKDKFERNENISRLKKELEEYLTKEGFENIKDVEPIFENILDELVHKNVLESEKRVDGRKLDQIRDLHAEVGLFRRLHGSGLFIRGGTQALALTTLAAPGAEQIIESMELNYRKRFLLHYNFPPFCTGETGKLGGTGRREIGHGALAYKAIFPMVPSTDEFPYTIRVVSEVLSSNGSSSMATTCATSLSLMDAGVPLKKTVAGIAMGIIVDQQPTTNDKQQNYKILTDIQGPEDHYGDMDCKVAGTDVGVNAMQMDVKITGITIEMLKEILVQAQKARMEILEVMNKAISKPREKVSEFAPVILTLDINPQKIGEVIGPGGKIINGIIEATKASSIDIEEDGKIFVTAPDRQKAEAAINIIKGIVKEYEIGEIVEGTIVRILEFGAIVDLGGGKDGMIHVSELKEGFVKKVEDVVRLGDFVRAKVIKVDNGKIGLSLKALG